MRSIAVFTATLLLGFGLILAQQAPSLSQDSQQVSGGCLFLPAYGTVYDIAGDEVVATDANQSQLLAEALSCAEKHFDAAEMAQYQAATGAIISDVPDPATAVVRLLVKAEIAATISSKPTVRQQDEVVRRLLGLLDDSGVVTLTTKRGLYQTLLDNHWTGFDRSSVTPAREGDYTAQCIEAGIPIPPPIGTKDGGWSDEMKLPSSRLDWMLSSSAPSVWTYKDKSNDGFCVALRRGDTPGDSEIIALGTICSNSSQTRACFFDSFIYKNGVATPLTEVEARQTPYSKLVHPEDIKNRCDSCHVGANPFIVNPHTTLGQLVRGLYTKVKPTRFDFVGAKAAQWWNPPFFQPASAAEGECVSCHALPGADTGSYCARILRLSGGWFMPLDWPDNPHWAKVKLWPVGHDDGCPAKAIPGPVQDYVESVHGLAKMCRPTEKIPDCTLYKAGTTVP